MADHPSTFQGDTTKSGAHAWEDRAVLLPADEESEVPVGQSSLLRGTFAEMIRLIVQLPEENRQAYVIAKSGDRHYSADEAMTLASHPDFPAQDPG